jgi:hypothetical protein
MITSVNIYAEEDLYSIGIWKFKSINGSVLVEGNYRTQENILNEGFYDRQNSTLFRGLLKLNTNTYVWNPNFLKLNINLDYSPNAINDNFLVIPNRTETTNAENIGINALFFDTKDINLIFTYNNGINYTMRDYGTSVKLTYNNIGSSIIYANTFAPIMVSFNQFASSDLDLNTSRSYQNQRTNLSGSVSKSFFEMLDNRLSISKDDMENTNYDSLKTSITINELKSDNVFSFDEKKENVISSNFSITQQKGNFNQDRIMENLSFRNKITEDLSSYTSYFYDNTSIDSLTSTTNSLNSRLTHQLYQSLKSYIFYQWYNTANFSADEKRNQIGTGFEYSKLISSGQINIKYELMYENDERISGNLRNIVKNEEHLVDDQKILNLKFPFIIEETIVVKDQTSGINYQKNADYIIINRGSFIGIQRVPGGRLQNKSTILVDYVSENPANYSYKMLAHNFSVNLSLFDKALEIYSNIYANNFQNVVYTQFAILNTVFSKLFGIQYNYENFNVGYELNLYESSIMPFNSHYINIKYSDQVSDDILISIFANYHNYHFTELDEDNIYTDISSRGIYQLNEKSSISAELGYLNQHTRNITSDFINFRAEYILRYAQIIISAGLDLYHRQIEINRNDYFGFFIKIERIF